MRTRRSNGGSGGSGSDSDSRSSRKGGDGRVRRRNDGPKTLVGMAWQLTKQVFFNLVHFYKSLTAFWGQLNMCMLPALGELDHQEELDAQQEREKSVTPGSPQRKRVSKEH